MAASCSQGVQSGSLSYANNENNASALTTERNSAGALPDKSSLTENDHASALSNNNAGAMPGNTGFPDNEHASELSANTTGAMPGNTGLDNKHASTLTANTAGAMPDNTTLTDNDDASNSTYTAPFSSGDIQLPGIKISETEWNDLKQLPAVQSCLNIFEDKKKIIFALQNIKNKYGKIPEDVKGNDIAKIIMDIEGKAEKENSPCAFMVNVDDKGHQDGSVHEVDVHYECEKCEAQGVKPVLKHAN